MFHRQTLLLTILMKKRKKELYWDIVESLPLLLDSLILQKVKSLGFQTTWDCVKIVMLLWSLFRNLLTERFFLEMWIGSTVLKMEFVPVVTIGSYWQKMLYSLNPFESNSNIVTEIEWCHGSKHSNPQLSLHCNFVSFYNALNFNI